MSTRRQLVGVDQPATARAQHLAGVVVDRLEQVGRRRVDRGDDAGAGLGAEPYGDRHRAVRRGDPALRDDLLDAGTVGERADLVAQRGQRGDVDVDDRPDLHPHVVHVELGAGGAARYAGPPDRLEAVLHRALGVREGGDVAVVVADDAELADLGQRDQSPVGGVLLRHALVEQDVLGRLDPGDVEVAEPPEVEAAADHRVHPAGEVVLGDAALVGGPEREVPDGALAPGTDRDRDPAYVAGERKRPDQRPEQLALLVGRLGSLGPVQVEVDHCLVAGTPLGEVEGDGSGEVAGRVLELRHGADRGHHAGRPVVEDVVGDHERAAVLDGVQVAQVELAVVPADQDLQHRLLGRDAALEPLRQEPHDLLGDRGQRLDPLGVVTEAAVGRQRGELVAHRGQHVGPLGVDRRLVEPAEPDAAGEVADDREPQLGGAAEPFEQGTGVAALVAGRRRLVDPASEQRRGQRDLGRRALLGQEDAEHRLLELGRALEVLDAVVAQHPEQPVAELVGQPAALDVEALQVGVEVLLGAVHPELGLRLLVCRAVAAELGEVGEGAEQDHLVGDHRDVLGLELVADREVVVERAVLVGRRYVVPEDDRGEVLAGACGACLQRELGGLLGQVEVGAGDLGDGLLGVVADLLELHERGTGLDLAAGDDEQLLDAGRERRVQHRLHLHRLEHQHRRTRLDLPAHRDGGGDHEGRGGRAEHAALVPADAVRDAVDLDQGAGAVGRGDHVVPASADREPAVELVDPVQLDVDGLLGAARGDRDAVAGGPGVDGGDVVRRAAQLELDRASGLVLGLGATAVGGLEQPADLEPQLVGVRLDGGGDHGDAGVLGRDQAALTADPVDPAGVGPRRGAGDDFGLVEQVEHEALVAGAALDHHGGPGHGPAQPGEGLLAGAAVGDDLGDHRVEVGRDGVALGHAGVDADAGTGGQVQPHDPAGSGREVAVGVLGVEAGLDGVSGLVRLLAVEAAAAGHVDLRLDQVDVGGHLGDGVLDLESGVDLEERERPVARVVEELDGAGTDVPDGDGEPLGRRLDLVVLLPAQQRGGGLLDDLLVAALDRAVADADRPGGAVAVGDHLHLDVTGAGHQSLEEHGAVAERAQGLVAGALVGVLEVGRGVHPADAATTATSGGLEHERVADGVGGGQRTVEGVDRAAAPRRDGDTDLLGDQLGPDLVAELAHRVGAGADEGDAEPVAQVDERGVLGDEAPTGPHGVRAALDQGPLEHLEVDVGAGRRGAQVVGKVGLAHEHRAALALGVQRDRLEGPVARRIDLPDRVDQAHRRLTAVHDRNAREHHEQLHRAVHRTALLRGPPATCHVWLVTG